MNDKNSRFLHSYLIDRKGQGQELDLDEVTQWSEQQGMLWVHFDISNREAGRWLISESALPPFAIDALLAGETRPRSVIASEGMLVVLRGVNTNPGADPEDMVAVRVWIDERRIVSTHRRRLLSIEDLSESLLNGRGPGSPGAFLVALVERLADRIGTFVESLEDRIDTAEDEIGKVDARGFRQRLGAMRRQIAEVRRFLAPQRDALDRLTRQSNPWLSDTEEHDLRQEADRITRLLEDLELLRERAIVLQEELLSFIAQEQNSRMYVLSIVAAVFLPLTFITGLLGMNVGGLPGLESPVGFAWSVIIMIVSAFALLVYFRWKRWL